jgi:hypothetical protein
VDISVINTELATVKSQLMENENANRVLQQTIKRRLPDLDSRLKAAKKALAELESVNAELRNTVASQSDALKTARTTLHQQRADIDRLRIALESTPASSLRGLGKGDARALAEAQRLTAELSRAHEELERARTGVEENMALRRELSKLASQILAVSRSQGAAQQPRVVVEVAQSVTQIGAIEPPPAPQAPHQHETEWQQAHAGNGAAQAPEDAEAGYEVDSVASGMASATEPEPHAEPAGDVADNAGEEKPSFARRFVSRREARRASLGDRLRGLVAERHES